ncbi:MAG: outer membrane beta-barrel protein [Bdellovibrionales bacterium]|nr:outer membrane beta-barrel protein [Bdellovibrionales bacterium]
MKFLTFMFVAFSFPAMAQFSEMAVTGGLQTTGVDADSGASVDGGSGFFAGILGFMELGNGGVLRSGALLNQRKWEVDSNNSEYETLNLDVPITYMYMVNDIIGIFGGAKFGLNISDDCSKGTLSTCDADPETIYYGGEIGGHFRFNPNFGVEATFDIGLSDIADQLAWKNSLVIGAFFLF